VKISLAAMATQAGNPADIRILGYGDETGLVIGLERRPEALGHAHLLCRGIVLHSLFLRLGADGVDLLHGDLLGQIDDVLEHGAVEIGVFRQGGQFVDLEQFEEGEAEIT
jgi:hypothetical protein